MGGPRNRPAPGTEPSDRLLPHEDPASRHPADAIHWTKVYAELLAVHTDVLHQAEERAACLETETAAELTRAMLSRLRADQDRFQRRHCFWTDRLRELDTGSQETPTKS